MGSSKRVNCHRATGFVSVALLVACLGCASYQFGAATLFPPNLRTIYVPMVRNETFRHDLGPLLTEAIQKTIEARTPYKVVGDPNADSTLTCRITAHQKRVISETITDEPRALESQISLQLVWTDRRGNLLMQNSFVPPGELAFNFINDTNFVPEGGQSIATANLRTVEELADQIVNQMEMRW
jgi:hypothetical protein